MERIRSPNSQEQRLWIKLQKFRLLSELVWAAYFTKKDSLEITYVIDDLNSEKFLGGGWQMILTPYETINKFGSDLKVFAIYNLEPKPKSNMIGNLIVAIAGTDPKSGSDLADNIRLTFGKTPRKVYLLPNLLDFIKQELGDRIKQKFVWKASNKFTSQETTEADSELTDYMKHLKYYVVGHSLGAALAHNFALTIAKNLILHKKIPFEEAPSEISNKNIASLFEIVSQYLIEFKKFLFGSKAPDASEESFYPVDDSVLFSKNNKIQLILFEPPETKVTAKSSFPIKIYQRLQKSLQTTIILSAGQNSGITPVAKALQAEVTGDKQTVIFLLGELRKNNGNKEQSLNDVKNRLEYFTLNFFKNLLGNKLAWIDNHSIGKIITRLEDLCRENNNVFFVQLDSYSSNRLVLSEESKLCNLFAPTKICVSDKKYTTSQKTKKLATENLTPSEAYIQKLEEQKASTANNFTIMSNFTIVSNLLSIFHEEGFCVVDRGEIIGITRTLFFEAITKVQKAMTSSLMSSKPGTASSFVLLETSSATSSDNDYVDCGTSTDTDPENLEKISYSADESRSEEDKSSSEENESWGTFSDIGRKCVTNERSRKLVAQQLTLENTSYSADESDYDEQDKGWTILSETEEVNLLAHTEV